mmetsp:Transcript_11193/g.69089  ORF Transcript_11193/g.69089 Transcript_11193/m.69089 type:complete len:165 (+) Transcript_11193:2894-3388(+)
MFMSIISYAKTANRTFSCDHWVTSSYRSSTSLLNASIFLASPSWAFFPDWEERWSNFCTFSLAPAINSAVLSSRSLSDPNNLCNSWGRDTIPTMHTAQARNTGQRQVHICFSDDTPISVGLSSSVHDDCIGPCCHVHHFEHGNDYASFVWNMHAEEKEQGGKCF